MRFNTKIPHAYQETLLACKNFEGPVDLCFDDLEIMLHEKFQEFITQFMETESFIHLKRTLLSDFMIGQQGGEQTLDNILSCIMGNCILFAFVNSFETFEIHYSRIEEATKEFFIVRIERPYL